MPIEQIFKFIKEDLDVPEHDEIKDYAQRTFDSINCKDAFELFEGFSTTWDSFKETIEKTLMCHTHSSVTCGF